MQSTNKAHATFGAYYRLHIINNEKDAPVSNLCTKFVSSIFFGTLEEWRIDSHVAVIFGIFWASGPTPLHTFTSNTNQGCQEIVLLHNHSSCAAPEYFDTCLPWRNRKNVWTINLFNLYLDFVQCLLLGISHESFLVALVSDSSKWRRNTKQQFAYWSKDHKSPAFKTC